MLKKIKQFSQRHINILLRNKFKLLAGGFIAFVIVALASQISVRKDVIYRDCTVRFGLVVSEWDGHGDDYWNHKDYHYQTRLYSVSSEVKPSFFTNVIENPPSLISTEESIGEANCESDGYVDTNDISMKWYGARPDNARLGAPQSNNKSKQLFIDNTAHDSLPVRPDTSHISSTQYSNPAAIIDDAGYALILSTDKSKSIPMWCQSYLGEMPVASCIDALKNSQATGEDSRGYLYTHDTCPVELSSCTQNTVWYTELVANNLAKLIGVRKDGSLSSFYVKLGAVSTKAHSVGSSTFVTYRYPRKNIINIKPHTQKQSSKVGDVFEITLQVSSVGPDIANISVQSESTDKILDVLQEFTVNDDNIDNLNNSGSVKLLGRFRLNQSITNCHDLNISTKILSVLGEQNAYSSTTHVEICNAVQPSIVYKYSVNSRGNISSEINEFSKLTRETLLDSRGWNRANIQFTEVNSDSDFIIYLSTPEQMTSFSSGCDSIYSCRVGSAVIINENRWNYATEAWNNSGGSLRDYRHMVINHEVGHWLGLGHSTCPKVNSLAPIMQQQSIQLSGCKFNPWPLDNEIIRISQ